ncbi:MAG: PAS domain-containing protein [Nitrospinae bacterium]|nr:PAS domain-containing protein [Nitrospinota bacterium]
MLELTVALGGFGIALAGALVHLRRRLYDIQTELALGRAEADAHLRLSRELETANTYLDILRAAEVAIRSTLGFTTAWIYLAEPDDPNQFRLLTAAGEKDDLPLPLLDVKGDAMMEEIVSSHRAVVVEDGRTDPRTNKDRVRESKVISIVNVPMLMADKLVGCLGTGTFGEEGVRKVVPREIKFLEEMGSRIAVALDRLRQFNIRQEEHKNLLKLIKAIEFAGDGILVADANYTVTYINPAFERIMGIPRESAIGQPMVNFRGLTERPSQLAEILAAGNQGVAWNGKLEIKRADGREMVLDATLSPVGEPGKAPGGYVAVLRDITGEERLNRAKDYFVQVTSHEMRTPLTKLQFCSHLINELVNRAARQEDDLAKCGVVMSEAYRSLQTIMDTTTTLTDMATPRTEKALPVNIGAVVLAGIAQAKEEMAAEGRRVELRADASLQADHLAAISIGHLTKAVMEILSNAVKFTPDGKGILARARVEGSNVLLEVVNEGVGITAEDSHRLFTPFYSTEKIDHHSSGRYKFKGGGLGLGLAVVKMIMDHYGGAVRVENRPDGQGIVTTLSIPLFA